jgi:hypothetical protein
LGQHGKVEALSPEKIEAMGDLLAAAREFRDIDERGGPASLWWSALSKVTEAINRVDGRKKGK